MEKDLLGRKYLLLFKLDVQSLYGRLTLRKDEYIEIFAMKRNRAHFNTIFGNKYETASLAELSYCAEETITALSQFFLHVEEIKWYLDHTQDMPNLIEDELTRHFHMLTQYYSTVMLYIDAELGIKSEPTPVEVDFSEKPEQDSKEEGTLPEDEAEFGENPWEEDVTTINEDN